MELARLFCAIAIASVALALALAAPASVEAADIAPAQPLASPGAGSAAHAPDRPAPSAAAPPTVTRAASGIAAAPGALWRKGKAAAGAAVRDLTLAAPAPAMAAREPADAGKRCGQLYYETRELVQRQHALRSRPRYWDDRRNQAIVFLGTVLTAPAHYLLGATAVQAYRGGRRHVELNARIDALRHTAARKGCYAY